MWSRLHFFAFGDSNFLTEQGRQPCVQPPNMEDQVPVFMSPSDRVAQLYPQAPGSLLIAFHVSQGYGGGILTRIHMRT
jgi:hypothetical protein